MLFYCCEIWHFNTEACGGWLPFGALKVAPQILGVSFYGGVGCISYTTHGLFDILVMFHIHGDLKKKLLLDVLVLQVIADKKLQNAWVCIRSAGSLVMGTPFCSHFLSLRTGHRVREIRLWGTWQNLGSEWNRFLTAVCYFLINHSSNSYVRPLNATVMRIGLNSYIHTYWFFFLFFTVPEIFYQVVGVSAKVKNLWLMKILLHSVGV